MGRGTDIIQGLTYAGFSLYGECLQSLARQGLRDYDWMQGHLSDFALAGQMTAFLLSAFGESRAGKALSAMAVPTAFTYHEFFPFSATEGTFDVQDIACFYAGAAVAYATSELCNTKPVQNFYSKLSEKLGLNETIENKI